MTDQPFEGEPTESAPHSGEPGFVVPDDISGIENLLEEGGPLEPRDLEPQDVVEVDPLTAAQQEAAERTSDLQRLQAEFLNYKRRVDRDRDLIRENAVFTVLLPMLDVLDNIDRAREAGELEGGFKGVAEQLERTVASLGLTRYGVPGDAFDPQLHEALSHVGTDPEVTVATAKHIAKTGYRIGDRVVRVAQVLVVDPEGDSTDEA
ncbi:MAG: grpE [Marmoricola sp.]|nr:grpE [Marmoricola sp.]